MKSPIQDSSSCDGSIGTYTRNHPKNDQDMGYTAASSKNIASTSRVLSNVSHGAIDLTTLIREVTAEALGTFVLMFCICGIVGNLNFMEIKTGLIEYALTAGLTVTVIIFSIGPISGAHLNPAVTIAFAAVGPFPWFKVPLYTLAQVGGSALATWIGKLVYGITSEIMLTRPIQGCKEAFSVELIATFITLFLITSLFNQQQPVGHLSGFLSGVVICVGVLISAPVSGGSMNPARSLGPALIAWRFDQLWIYIVAPVIGAVSGVAVYRILRLQGWSCESDPPKTMITSREDSKSDP